MEVISELSEKDANVRPSDIAQELKVKRPSVTSALNSLADKGLVEYEKYRPVILTKEGKKHAVGIQKKHAVLRQFFTDILGVDASEADIAACKMEHSMNDAMMKKLTHFMDDITPCTTCKQANCDGHHASCPRAVTLAELKIGEKGVILSVDKSIGDISRYAGMGMVMGSVVKILRFATLGDPVVICVRGSEISLRKSQMRSIKVKKL